MLFVTQKSTFTCVFWICNFGVLVLVFGRNGSAKLLKGVGCGETEALLQIRIMTRKAGYCVLFVVLDITR